MPILEQFVLLVQNPQLGAVLCGLLIYFMHCLQQYVSSTSWMEFQTFSRQLGDPLFYPSLYQWP
jgi:hypothetical protein